MKRCKMAFALILSIIFISFSSCSGYSAKEIQEIRDDSWDKGFDAGYSEGYSDGMDAHSNFWDDPGDYSDIEDIVSEAYGYAAIGDIDPMEAWYIIDCYQNKEAYYDNGALPTKDDYDTAAAVLLNFYCYFENGEYK